jgi:hypothetical protein
MENQESVVVILVSCLLFVYLELLLEDVKGAMVYAHSGVSILEAWQSEKGRPLDANNSTSILKPDPSLIPTHLLTTRPLSSP